MIVRRAIILGAVLAMSSSITHAHDNHLVKITLSLSSETTHSITSTTLSIPEPYIDSHPDGRNLLLKALLPDFRPLPPEARRTSPSFNYAVEADIARSDDYVSISVSQGAIDGMAGLIKDSIEHDWTSWDVGEDFTGFLAFRSKMLANSERDPLVAKTVYLLPIPERENSKIYFLCPVPNVRESLHLYCTAYTEFPHLLFGRLG
jgi:hypothetical protein